MPTVLDLFDLPEPYELAGGSLSPLLRDGGEADTAALRGRLIFHSHNRYASRGVVQYAVIELPRWKLTHTYQRTPVGPGWKHTRFALHDLRGGLYADEDVIDEHRDVAVRVIQVDVVLGGVAVVRREKAAVAAGKDSRSALRSTTGHAPPKPAPGSGSTTSPGRAP